MASHPTGFNLSERAVQARAGVSAERQKKASAALRPFMPEQHRLFFEALPIVFLGLIDQKGRPWATLADGAPGFLHSHTPERLDIGATPVLAEELGLAHRPGDKVGVLGLDLTTRRRNRMNGTVVGELERGGIAVSVDQSFGNCPQYIQVRHFEVMDRRHSVGLRPVDTFSGEARRIVDEADTFFIASRTANLEGGPGAGLDVSHRGGLPGFLHRNADGSLSFPDFAGNRFFNTLGNIEDDGRVGLLIPAFADGSALYLTGHASIDWDSGRVQGFKGAERIIDVQPALIFLARHALPAKAGFVEVSPKLADTGTWPEM